MSKLVSLGTVLAQMIKARVRNTKLKKSEFDLSTKMVSLLYFHALVVAAQTWCPATTIFATMMIDLNFRFARFDLLAFTTKPKKPFKAQDAGNIFIRYYFATMVIMGLVPLNLLMQGTSFPKTCNLMDARVNLCQSSSGSSLSSFTNCTLDRSSIYYAYFTSVSRPPECSHDRSSGAAYPSCLCGSNDFHGHNAKLACGPTIEFSKAFSVVIDVFHLNRWTGNLYDVFNDHIVLVFGLAFLLFLAVISHRNHISVLHTVAEVRDSEWEAKVATLQFALRRNEKQLKKLRSAAGFESPSAKTGDGNQK